MEPKPTYETETERVNTLEFELYRLITLHLRCIGENNRLRAEIAELREGKPGSEPPVVGEGLRSSGMKLVKCRDGVYNLAHYYPVHKEWIKAWSPQETVFDVVTWWELPGGTK